MPQGATGQALLLRRYRHPPHLPLLPCAGTWGADTGHPNEPEDRRAASCGEIVEWLTEFTACPTYSRSLEIVPALVCRRRSRCASAAQPSHPSPRALSGRGAGLGGLITWVAPGGALLGQPVRPVARALGVWPVAGPASRVPASGAGRRTVWRGLGGCRGAHGKAGAVPLRRAAMRVRGLRLPRPRAGVWSGRCD